MSYRIGILGRVPESSAILIGKNGSVVHHVTHPSGMEWRDSAAISCPLITNQLMELLATRVGAPTIADLIDSTTHFAIAIAGIDRRFYIERFLNAMYDAGIPKNRLYISSLAEAAHVGAFLGAPGILVRCGHGTSAFLKRACGDSGLSGGWGCTIGDHGSGVWLGRKALGVVARMADQGADHDEREFTDGLLRILSRGEPATPGQLFEQMEAERAVGRDIAVRKHLTSIAYHVISLASQGDPVASTLLNRAYSHLLQMIRGAGKTSGVTNDQLPVCVRGSLIEENEYFCNGFYESLKGSLPFAMRPQDDINGSFSATVGIGLLALECSEPCANEDLRSAFLSKVGEFEWAEPALRILPRELRHA